MKALFQFDRDFPWWGPNTKCVGCALVLYMFGRGRIQEIPEEAAKAAEQAGAGRRVNYEAMQQ